MTVDRRRHALAAWALVGAALALPLIATLSQFNVFGPNNAIVAARYPTLLMAAGYAFSIWGLLFTLDLVVAFWQARRSQRDLPEVVRWRPWLLASFVLMSAWMVLFPMQLFGTALAVIWLAWATMARAAVLAVRPADAPPRKRGLARWARITFAAQAGWLTMAALLNTAQTLVAYRLAPVDDMLPWTLALWVGAAALVLWLARQLRGHGAFVATVAWALIAVVVHQLLSPLPGSGISAAVAALLLIVLLAFKRWARRGRSGSPIVLNLQPDDVTFPAQPRGVR